MPAIVFTVREMKRAWRNNLAASLAAHDHSPRSNSHRLLLFYAVECGLKAILMQRQNVSDSSASEEVVSAQHNINKLLSALKAGQDLTLPSQIQLRAIQIGSKEHQRQVQIDGLNQVWRYGGECQGCDTDPILEDKLQKIVSWIEQEL